MRTSPTIVGTMVPLMRSDVDTDQLLPKQFLTRLEATGYGDFLFYSWREDPEFVLNDERFKGGSILVAGANFGCGSSREQAAWATRDYGFEAVIAPSFGSRFQTNCIRSGVLAATASPEACQQLGHMVLDTPQIAAEIDMVAATVSLSRGGQQFSLDIPQLARRVLVDGIDDIEYTRREAAGVASYEADRASWMPSVRAVAAG